jgi:stress-induced morphogen
MGDHPTDFQGSIPDAITEAVTKVIPGARVVVESGSQGHYSLTVVSPVFEGKTLLASQRLVLGAIAHLMKGDRAPVHAVDKLTTRT